jgi:glycosidase
MDFVKESQITLQRLWPRLESVLPKGKDQTTFYARLESHFPTVFRLLYDIYGQRYDFFYHLEQIMLTTAQMYAERAADLKALDYAREQNPAWFHSEKMIGGVCYVDLFAGDLEGIRERIPYFEELKLTYLHLMPLFRCPAGHNDGGYAISSYREVDPRLGTTEQLASLAADLRQAGISLVLDFVFNHTSDEHEWALRALAGEAEYQDFYFMFPDRTLPDQYERTLREIFPEQAPGSFTYRPEVDRWVWTTFHNFQWDLNYANPHVFRAMLGEMLFIANLGVEVLRLDAVAFIWKQMGTGCEGLPQVHTLIQAFNALARIAAPAMLFKSEAIVHPAEVARYIHPQEAPISYNPTLMALLWEALATRRVTLLHHSMQRRFATPPGCTWVNYIRCHDDIGWTFADEDAWELNINGYDHRQFLNRFYTGQFSGSFARGVPFNFNPVNQDMRISGMAASLAGLEQALDTGNDRYRALALRRLELIFSVMISAGGIPLIYLGDEIAMLNNYSYRDHPDQFDDSRWVHRLSFDWARAEQRGDPDTDAGRIFQTVRKLIEIRRSTPAFANGQSQFFNTRNEHVLGYVRGGRILVLANFSETEESARVGWMPANPVDLITGEPVEPHKPVTLGPYQFVWLTPGR